MPRILPPRNTKLDVLCFILGPIIWLALLLVFISMISSAHGGDCKCAKPTPAPRYVVTQQPDQVQYAPAPRPQQIIVAPAPEYRLSDLEAMTPSERERYYFEIFLRNPSCLHYSAGNFYPYRR